MIAQIRTFDIRPGDIRVVAGPVYHSAPNLYALYAVRDGGLVILQPRFEAEDSCRSAASHHALHGADHARAIAQVAAGLRADTISRRSGSSRTPRRPARPTSSGR
jgi:hypothetical protein